MILAIICLSLMQIVWALWVASERAYGNRVFRIWREEVRAHRQTLAAANEATQRWQDEIDSGELWKNE